MKIKALILILSFAFANVATASRMEHTFPLRFHKKTELCDTLITSTMNEMLLEDSDLSSPKIHVQTCHQIVTLTGSTDNKDDKENAISLAKTIRGVKAVKSHVKITSRQH